MNKIEFNIRKGLPKGSNWMFNSIGWYPEWYLKVQGENDISCYVSPRISEMRELIKTIILYEKLQMYDFFKQKETSKGSTRDLFESIFAEIDDISIEEIRELFSHHFVYQETIKRKNEVLSKNE